MNKNDLYEAFDHLIGMANSDKEIFDVVGKDFVDNLWTFDNPFKVEFELKRLWDDAENEYPHLSGDLLVKVLEAEYPEDGITFYPSQYVTHQLKDKILIAAYGVEHHYEDINEGLKEFVSYYLAYVLKGGYIEEDSGEAYMDSMKGTITFDGKKVSHEITYQRNLNDEYREAEEVRWSKMTEEEREHESWNKIFYTDEDGRVHHRDEEYY